MHTSKNINARKSTTPRLRPRICSAMILAAGLTTQVYGVTVTFQNGVGGYTGYKTSTIAPATPATPSVAGLFTSDGGATTLNDAGVKHALFMFDNLFNNDGGPIPIGATINSASMVANFDDGSGTSFSLNRMIMSWDPATATWNFFTGGVQADNTEAASTATFTFTAPGGGGTGTYNPYGTSLATDIALFASGTANNGWVVLPTAGVSGWGHSAGQINTAILTIDYTFGATKNLVWNTHPTGTWDTGVGANLAWLNGVPTDFFSNGDNATFSQTPSPTSITVAAGGVSPNSFTISNASGQYNFTGAGITGPLAKSGAGSVVFSNTGNSLGAATVSGGSATFDNATTFSSLAASGGSTVVLKAANTNAGGTTISGGASVETQIAGALGAGTIALNGGTLKATTAAAQTHANAWSINATNGGIIDVAGGTTLTLSTNVSATTGVLTKNGTGTLIVNGGFGGTYTGSSLVINDGTIRVAGTGNSLASATIINLVSATSVFDDSPGDGENMGGFTGLGTFIEKDSPTAAPLFLSNGVNLSFSFAGKITGGSGGVIGISPVGDDRRFNLTKGGTGTITLSGGTSDFAGQTIIQGGTLSISTLTARGVASSIGFGTTHTTAGTNVAAPGSTDIVIGSAAVPTTLEYTGGNTSSNRAIALASTGAVAIGVTNAAAKLTLTGLLSSTATPSSFTKNGPGTLELTNANTYLGPTIVADGTLLASNTTGSATDGGNVTVNAAGTFGGTGIITGSVTVDGKLSPGASIESLATGTVALQTGSMLVYEASPVDVNFADLLDITGNLNLTGSVALDVLGANLADPAWGLTTLSIASYTGTWNGGTFAGWADDSSQAFGGNLWTINYNDIVAGINFTSEQPAPGTQNFVTLTQTVPEPSALLSLLGGSALLLARRRRS